MQYEREKSGDRAAEDHKTKQGTSLFPRAVMLRLQVLGELGVQPDMLSNGVAFSACLAM